MSPIDQDTRYMAIQGGLILLALLAGIGVATLLLSLLEAT